MRPRGNHLSMRYTRAFKQDKVLNRNEPPYTLFYLAPGRVYPHDSLLNPVVRSYRTFSPLPISGRFFSVALSMGLRPP